MSVDERIKLLEGPNGVAGTQLIRQLGRGEGTGVRWCLGIGSMGSRLIQFHGATIEECLTRAEEVLIRGMPRREDDDTRIEIAAAIAGCRNAVRNEVSQ